MGSGERRTVVGRAAVAGRVVAGVVGAAAVVAFVLFGWVAVSSRFGLAGPDVHGYGLLFGSILAVGAALVATAVLPLAFARSVRSTVYMVALLLLVVVTVLAVASVLTA
jgi:hypothetical protein